MAALTRIMKPTVFKCTLGFDAKITPEDRPVIIEINGSNSGIAGLEKITGDNLAIVREQIREQILGKEPETTLNYSLVSTAETPAPGIDAPFYHKLVFNPLAPQVISSEFQGRKNYYLVKPQPERVEKISEDKVAQKKYIDPEFQALYWIFDGSRDGVRDFAEALAISWLPFADYPYVVGKYSSGNRGEHVRIFEGSEVPHMYAFLEMCPRTQRALLEAYIPSKEIDGNKNGCMRYLADFFVFRDEDGQADFQKGYEGAYWRIPPGVTPESYYDRMQRTFIANFSGKYPAKPIAASKEDMAVVRPAVDSTIKNLVKDSALWM